MSEPARWKSTCRDTQSVGEFERNLGHEFSSRQVAAFFEFEQESFGTDHRTGVEALGQSIGGHERSP